MPNEHRFVALYSGDSICTARMVFASADPRLVQQVAERITEEKLRYPLNRHRSTVHTVNPNPKSKKTAEVSKP